MASQHTEHGEGLQDPCGHRLVRKKHELLDELVRFPHLILRDIGWILRLAVQLKANLLRGELQGTFLHPSRTDYLRQAVQVPDCSCELALVGGIVHAILCLRIREGFARLDDRLAEARTHDLRLLCHLPEYSEGEPLDAPTERADVRRQETGEHVGTSLDEIDRGAPLSGLLVDCRVRTNEVCDICDVHTYPEVPIRQRLAGDCIIDILATWGVDGATTHAPQVLAVHEILGADEPVRFGQAPQHSFPEFPRDHPMLMQDDVTLHRPIPDLPKNLRPVSPRAMAITVPTVDDNNNALMFEVCRMPSLH
mmetsp:Transcript_64041/g.141108  ORF Transcript_64041/g.141108 Transcript_64041/m.141108 type:complete len:308 (+) Transcript_64041:890-1813(+)